MHHTHFQFNNQQIKLQQFCNSDKTSSGYVIIGLGLALTDLLHCHVGDSGEVVGGGVLARVLILKEHFQLCLQVVHCGQLLGEE